MRALRRADAATHLALPHQRVELPGCHFDAVLGRHPPAAAVLKHEQANLQVALVSEDAGVLCAGAVRGPQLPQPRRARSWSLCGSGDPPLPCLLRCRLRCLLGCRLRYVLRCRLRCLGCRLRCVLRYRLRYMLACRLRCLLGCRLRCVLGCGLRCSLGGSPKYMLAFTLWRMLCCVLCRRGG